MRKTFPKIYRFKSYTQRQRQAKLPNIAHIISNSENKDDFLHKIRKLTLRDIRKIERRTVGQWRTSDWHFYRKCCITASIGKRITTAIRNGEDSLNINKAITKKECFELNYPAVIYGRDNEERAIQAFLKKYKSQHIDLKVSNVGFRLDKTLSIIGGSADGVVTCSCCPPRLIEVKCPYDL